MLPRVSMKRLFDVIMQNQNIFVVINSIRYLRKYILTYLCNDAAKQFNAVADSFTDAFNEVVNGFKDNKVLARYKFIKSILS